MAQLRTYTLALEFYKKCQLLEISNSVKRNQFERASLSVLLNISEGSGRIKTNDRRHFYSIAFGSLRETQTLLLVLNQSELVKESDCLAAHLFKLIKSPGGL